MFWKLKLGKSTGSDNVNNRVLKELPAALSKPLSDLFNTSCLGPIFLIFRKKQMFHLSIKNDPSLVNNYRPISLLSALGKVMENITHKQMFTFLLDHLFTIRHCSR